MKEAETVYTDAKLGVMFVAVREFRDSALLKNGTTKHTNYPERKQREKTFSLKRRNLSCIPCVDEWVVFSCTYLGPWGKVAVFFAARFATGAFMVVCSFDLFAGPLMKQKEPGGCPTLSVTKVQNAI
ncbi:MAG TPA: hypothetical protein VMZ26_10040 [Pyrinomonadaceae bacterium]|nr:hypothetical protein [Pyrinomonadaceae bacterium]